MVQLYCVYIQARVSVLIKARVSDLINRVVLGVRMPPFSIVVGVSRPCILPGGLRSFYNAQAAPRIPQFNLV